MWAQWTGVAGDEALAFFQSQTLSNRLMNYVGIMAETNYVSGPGYWINFFPREFVEAVFTKTLAENKFLIPEYVYVEVDVEGKQLLVSGTKARTEDQPLLGAAVQTANYLQTSDGARYELKFYLASRGQMLSAEHRRARLFGALIIGAALAAFIGFVAAYRAFRREQQLSEMKSNFVSSVSHELRAPIASVRLMAENLERGKIPNRRSRMNISVSSCRNAAGFQRSLRMCWISRASNRIGSSMNSSRRT
ncbi:MAG: histidine kinase dimerization/phospho-acceptor domain-containing protein [Limisphaerales bacterium]